MWIVHYITANNTVTPYSLDMSKIKNERMYPSTLSSINTKFLLKLYNKQTEKIKHKISARFEIRKDTTQAVLPVSKVILKLNSNRTKILFFLYCELITLHFFIITLY